MVNKKTTLRKKLADALTALFNPTLPPPPLVDIGYRDVDITFAPKGSSGTTLYSGYFDEEYLASHKGETAADTYDKMRRSDAVLTMILSAVKNPIKGAVWAIKDSDELEDPEKEKMADLVRRELFENPYKPWAELLSEALSCVDYGFSVFEIVNRVVLNDPKFGTYIGLGQAGFRSQRTIQRWHLRPENGKIDHIVQWAFGDLKRNVNIDGEFLMVITLNKEGDNYEGVSMLRACLGPWKRKELYLKLMAIGIEKNAVPTPVATIPAGKENSPEEDKMIEVLSSYTSHENAYVMKPAGWELDFQLNNYDPEKTKTAIEFENREMVYAFLANFLLLGTSTTSGSFSLSFDLSDFFLSGIEHIAHAIRDKIQQHIIKPLIDLNFGPQEEYPELAVTGISDKAGKEFAEMISLLVGAKVLTPDANLEENLRKRTGLPEKSEVDEMMPMPAPVAPTAPQPTMTMPEHQMPMSELKLAEAKTAKALITEATKDLKSLMQGQISSIGAQLVNDLVKKSASLSKSQKAGAIKKVKVKGVAAYKDQLIAALASLSTQAYNQATKGFPGSSKMKLSESIILSEFDKLPKSVQEKIKAQAGLLTETQMNDLQKSVFFQFSSSVGSSLDSDVILESDLSASVEKYVEGPSVVAAAGDTAATMVNESRNAFFFDEETLGEIESFTFTNGDPVSPICQDLAGTTFAADDESAQRYFPPLHHNCKSFLVPNLKGGPSANKEIGKLSPSSSSLEKYITLSELVPGKKQ